ncbi:hypothetical protein [Streptomyces sp. S465]|uniref:hypothetical protein n=1 Tax=Streptomyces sp. S465 TaxID=2979468 RepID=UPI0022A894ED|nr:hypothetical protein [Streptomyces sp. S465]WAP59965.1 hypothetical protein N6H00_36230 [Streptomyces sp. S465]
MRLRRSCPARSPRRADRLRPVLIDRPALRGRLVFAWRADGPSGPAGRALVERARTALGGPSRPASGSATG